VLVLCPKKTRRQLAELQSQPEDNIFRQDRFSYDVLCHTDLQRTSGYSFGVPLKPHQLGATTIWSSSTSPTNFRNNEVFKDRETRYQKLMNAVIREGVKTKVLMLSRDARQQSVQRPAQTSFALAYEGEPAIWPRSCVPARTSTKSSAAPRLLSMPGLPFRRGTHPRRHPRRPGLRLFELLDFGHHRPLPEAHRDVLRTKDIGKFPER